MFLADALINYYIGTMILEVVKKVIDIDNEHAFIAKVIDDCLQTYRIIETKKTSLQKAKPNLPKKSSDAGKEDAF